MSRASPTAHRSASALCDDLSTPTTISAMPSTMPPITLRAKGTKVPRPSAGPLDQAALEDLAGLVAGEGGDRGEVDRDLVGGQVPAAEGFEVGGRWEAGGGVGGDAPGPGDLAQA